MYYIYCQLEMVNSYQQELNQNLNHCRNLKVTQCPSPVREVPGSWVKYSTRRKRFGPQLKKECCTKVKTGMLSLRRNLKSFAFFKV